MIGGASATYPVDVKADDCTLRLGSDLLDRGCEHRSQLKQEQTCLTLDNDDTVDPVLDDMPSSSVSA